jgi:hypothetical protein
MNPFSCRIRPSSAESMPYLFTRRVTLQRARRPSFSTTSPFSMSVRTKERKWSLEVLNITNTAPFSPSWTVATDQEPLHPLGCRHRAAAFEAQSKKVRSERGRRRTVLVRIAPRPAANLTLI